MRPMSIHKHAHAIILAIVFLIGLIIRIGLEPKYPQGFHRDEAVITYDAYSILMTGKDHWGEVAPLHFKSLGDYPPGIYNYTVALAIALIGYGELAGRLPAILAGSLLIPIVYLLINKLFKQPKLSLVTALLLAVSPWDVVQSRAGSEAILGLLFFCLSWLSLIQWKKGGSFGWLITSSVLGFLAMFSYNAIKLGLPLLFTYYFLVQTNQFKQLKTTAIWLGCWWMLGVGSVFMNAGTAMSLSATSVLNTQETGSLSVAFIREGNSHIPVLVSRILHNRLMLAAQNITKNYLTYFSADFLLWRGGFPGRYAIPSVGLLYLVLVPCIGYSLIGKGLLSKQQLYFVLGWLLLAPIVAAITNTDVPNVKRAVFMFLPLYILAANGFLAIYQAINHTVGSVFFLIICIGILGWEMLWFSTHYLAHSGYETVHNRSYGWKQVFEFINQHSENFQAINIYEDNDSPYIFYLFYSRYAPAKYQTIAHTNPGNVFSSNKKTWQLDGLTFIPTDCPQSLKQGVLYVSPALRCSKVITENSAQILNQVLSPDGTPKFDIYTVTQVQKSL